MQLTLEQVHELWRYSDYNQESPYDWCDDDRKATAYRYIHDLEAGYLFSEETEYYLDLIEDILNNDIGYVEGVMMIKPMSDGSMYNIKTLGEKTYISAWDIVKMGVLLS